MNVHVIIIHALQHIDSFYYCQFCTYFHDNNNNNNAINKFYYVVYECVPYVLFCNLSFIPWDKIRSKYVCHGINNGKKIMAQPWKY